MNIEQLERSPRWEKSIGKAAGAHYREKGGKRHAVCDPETGLCKVHQDSVNAHENPLQHLVQDAPEVLAAGIILGGLAYHHWRRRH